jgi:hypothetical protein
MGRAGDLRLSVLGELRGSRGGAPVELGGRRQRVVLAALIIARGDAVLGDRLADCIWGEQPPANAPATLQSYVSHLRRRLEPHAAARTRDGIIIKVGPGYAIRLGLEAVDAWRFEGALLAGEVTGKPFDGPYTATLAGDDGSLPVPGECEPATATLSVTGPRGKYLDLAATGQVCGRWTDAVSIVTHRFTGRYEVVATSERKLRGGDGWIGVLLATEGRANVEAFDS